MKTKDKVKKITFFYNSSDVDEYIRNNRNAQSPQDNELFIAMTPLAYSHLKQNGIRTESTLKYFTNDSHKRLLEKSKVLVNWLRKNSNFVDPGIGVQQTIKESFIFRMRSTIHYCLWTIEIVLNAVNRHKPNILSAPYSGKRTVLSLYIEPEEKYLGHIVKTIAQIKNLEYEDISRIKTDNYSLRLSQVRGYVISLFKFLFKYWKFQLWKNMVLAKIMFTKKRPVFLTSTCNIDAMVKRFCRKTVNRMYYLLKSPVIPSFNIPDFIIRMFWRPYITRVIEQKRIFEDLEKIIKKETVFFSYKNVPFAGIISQKIKDNIRDHILGLMLWSTKLNQFISRSIPTTIISDGNHIDDLILTELCRGKGIPAILVSHGSFVHPENRYEWTEWGQQGSVLLNAPFSHLALQSPLSEGYLDAFPSTAKLIKTGPLVWGKPVNQEKSRTLFEKMFNGKYDFGKIKIVLHAGSPKSSNTLRLYVYETPDEYIQAICELANAVEKIPNTILIVKVRPSPEIRIKDFNKLVPFSEKVILCVSKSFNDVLGMADLLVSFSSTTIEEALQNRIPVLLYGGGGRYQHVPAYQIKRDGYVKPSAAYHVREARDLEYAISRVLNLNIGSEKNKALFEPYIYGEHQRASLMELIKSA